MNFLYASMVDHLISMLCLPFYTCIYFHPVFKSPRQSCFYRDIIWHIRVRPVSNSPAENDCNPHPHPPPTPTRFCRVIHHHYQGPFLNFSIETFKFASDATVDEHYTRFSHVLPETLKSWLETALLYTKNCRNVIYGVPTISILLEIRPLPNLGLLSVLAYVHVQYIYLFPYRKYHKVDNIDAISSKHHLHSHINMYCTLLIIRKELLSA